ncbi:MAG: beta-ketoacyl-ACP synthase II [Candidatus Sumerlaeota bacterium]|nr:beta-ketoacyl-ACP synthase II [Candidatus Sumerlaeota bacterium]
MKRIVVTGLGALTPIGNDVPSFWNNLVAGKSGVGFITRFDHSEHRAHIAAEIKNFEPEKHFEKKDLKNLEPFIQYALIAAREAWADARFTEGSYDPDRFGVVIGSGIGGIEVVEKQAHIIREKGPRSVTPFLVPRLICNEAPGYVSIDLKLRGPNTCIVTACATGTHCIGDAAAIIARDDADAMVCGATDGAITPLAIAGFANMRALSQEATCPERASCPFDLNRDGFVMGEGAGIMVLESLEHAQKRGARIYAEIVGYGMSGDAYHITAPSPCGEGGARAMLMALRNAGLRPEQIDYINAHGTSTPLNDKLETEGIKKAFGEHARKLAISANKSMIGHLIGAAGAVEGVATVLTICHSMIPPTINYETPDPECDLDYVPNVARPAEVNCALNSSLGFGGHNTSIIFKKFVE